MGEARIFCGKPIGFLHPVPKTRSGGFMELEVGMEGSLRASSSCGCAAGRLAKQTGCNEPRADL